MSLVPLLALPELLDRGRATLLGGAVGDALGAPVEFLTRSEIQAEHGVLREMIGGGWLRLRPGQVTDDTEMSLCVARSLVEVGWSPRDLADRFVAWLRSRPVDVGSTCRRGIRRYLLDGTLSGEACTADGGNGAAMRVAPVALATLGDPAMLERQVVEQAHLTHHHALSDAACVLVGRLVQSACAGATKTRLRRTADELVQRLPTFRFDPYPGLASGYVVDTLQTVLHGFFTTRTFEDCLVLVVNQGGDADTTGAIAGAIAGAYYGERAIPPRWTRRLDPSLRAELSSLARHLVERSPHGRRTAVQGSTSSAA